MTVCALVMVRDEHDVIEATLRHLALHVDEILVLDNGSTDGTPEILHDLRASSGLPLHLYEDDEVGYWQERRMTHLAHEAFLLGHRWVVPCDADEIWHAHDGRLVKEHLEGLAPDVLVCHADLHDHIPTCLDDPSQEVPQLRETWRFVNRAGLPKVAARTMRDLIILPGNHNVAYPSLPLVPAAAGLVVRHFSWRTEDQYLRKITNGALAYAATDLDPELGAHWRMHGLPSSPDFDRRVRHHFRRWFYVGPGSESDDPREDDRLVEDPCPLAFP